MKESVRDNKKKTIDRKQSEQKGSKVKSVRIGEVAMKVLTAADKVTNVGNENEPTVVVESQKLTKEELNRFVELKVYL